MRTGRRESSPSRHAGLGERHPRARRGGEDLSGLVPPAVASYIAAAALPLDGPAQEQRVVLEALEDVKGRDIVVFNTARMPSMSSAWLIASGRVYAPGQGLADRVQEKVREGGARVLTASRAKRAASGCGRLWRRGGAHHASDGARFLQSGGVWGGKTVRFQLEKNPNAVARLHVLAGKRPAA